MGKEHLYRSHRVLVRPVADLTVLVIPAAPRAAVRPHGACVDAARTERLDRCEVAAPTPHADRGQPDFVRVPRVPSPSRPDQVAPQHHTDPSVFSAHVCWAPALTDLTEDRGPPPSMTWTGVIRRPSESPRVPSPSWPQKSPPQHHTVLSLFRAQLCPYPALTWTTSSPAARADGAGANEGERRWTGAGRAAADLEHLQHILGRQRPWHHARRRLHQARLAVVWAALEAEDEDRPGLERRHGRRVAGALLRRGDGDT